MGKLSQQDVDNWLLSASQPFHYKDVLNGQVSPDLFPQLRVYVGRSKYCEKMDGRSDGWFRPKDMELEELEWWVTEGKGVDIKLPMGLHKYCEFYLPCVILVSGLYNQGKTAFLMNIVNLNMDNFDIRLFLSEGGELLKKRMDKLNSFIPKPPPFKSYHRRDNFQDIIFPHAFNIIDYLRVDADNLMASWNDIGAIANKLGKDGVAVIAMQKPPGRKLAYGGPGTAFEPQLYMWIDKGRCGFEKIKVPKPSDVDPYSLVFNFTIKNGVNFEDLHTTTTDY